MRTEQVMMTPEMAQKILDENNLANYRTLRKRVIDMYARDMENGLWQENGVPICIAENGILKDGQHRLSAIVKSGATIPMIVVYDVPADVDIYDTGAVRNYIDVLRAKGIFADNTMIGAARLILAKSFNPHGLAVSKSQVAELVQKHEELFYLASTLIRTGSSRSICRRKAIVLATVYLLYQGESDKLLSEFFSVVNTGFPNEDHNPRPAIVMRNQLMNTASYGIDKLYAHMSVQAFMDYKNNKSRTKIYAINPTLDDKFKAFFEKMIEEEHR